MKLAQSKKYGFTLIELLVVIGILAILLAITLIAINPQRQFQQANDTQRSSNVNAILNAVGQFAADNNGRLPGDIPIGAANAEEVGFVAAGNGADLCTDLVPTYMAGLPVDPTSTDPSPITTCPAAGTAYATGYTIFQDANQRVTVTAVGQITPSISVTR